VNEPAAEMTPRKLASVAAELGRDRGLDVEILDADAAASSAWACSSRSPRAPRRSRASFTHLQAEDPPKKKVVIIARR